SNNHRPFTMVVTSDPSSVNVNNNNCNCNFSTTTIDNDNILHTKCSPNNNNIFHQLQVPETKLEVIEPVEKFDDDKNKKSVEDKDNEGYYFKGGNGKDDDDDKDELENKDIKNGHVKEVTLSSPHPQPFLTLSPSPTPPISFLTPPIPTLTPSPPSPSPSHCDDDGELDEFVDAQENINEL